MNDKHENETLNPLTDEHLGEVAGGFVATPLPGGIGGRIDDLVQRGPAAATFGTLEQKSYRMCPNCGLRVAPVDGKCPRCGALMSTGPVEFI